MERGAVLKCCGSATRFVSNPVVVTGTIPVFRFFDGLGSLEMHNDVFYRSGGSLSSPRDDAAVRGRDG